MTRPTRMDLTQAAECRKISSGALRPEPTRPGAFAVPSDTAERILSRVTVTGDCWIWTAGLTGNGYAALRHEGKMVLAHRLSYELHVGPILEGLVIDHLCRNRACVNPAHLEPVTNRVNILRGESPSALAAIATHCKHGHEFTSTNTRIKRSGKRSCRECDRAQKRGERSRTAKDAT